MTEVSEFVDENRKQLEQLVERRVANDWVIEAMLEAYPDNGSGQRV